MPPLLSLGWGWGVLTAQNDQRWARGYLGDQEGVEKASENLGKSSGLNVCLKDQDGQARATVEGNG